MQNNQTILNHIAYWVAHLEEFCERAHDDGRMSKEDLVQIFKVCCIALGKDLDAITLDSDQCNGPLLAYLREHPMPSSHVICPCPAHKGS